MVGPREGEVDLRDAEPDGGHRRLGEADSREGDAGSRRLWPALVAVAESAATGSCAACRPTRSSYCNGSARVVPFRLRPRAPRRVASSPSSRTSSNAGCSRAATAEHTPAGHHVAVPGNVGGLGKAPRYRDGGPPDGGGRARGSVRAGPAPGCGRAGRRACSRGSLPDERPSAADVSAARLSAAGARSSTIVGREFWRGGREAEGGGLLNRYTAQKLYRGFESLPLRNFCKLSNVGAATGAPSPTASRRPCPR